VAEKRAGTAGVSPAVAIEMILLDVRREIGFPEPESSLVPEAPNVNPITRGRRGQRHPARRPD
jgi:hypothetical protein